MGDGNAVARGNSKAQKAVDGTNTDLTILGGLDGARKIQQASGLKDAAKLKDASGLKLPDKLGPLGGLLSAIGIAQDIGDIAQDGFNKDNTGSLIGNSMGLGSAILGATPLGIALGVGAGGMAAYSRGNAFMDEHGWLGQNPDGTNRDWGDMREDWGEEYGLLGTIAGGAVGVLGGITTGIMGFGEDLLELPGNLWDMGKNLLFGDDKEKPRRRPMPPIPDGMPGPTGPCFGPGVLIEMSDGSQRPIQDVLEGDAVVAFSEITGTTVTRRVLKHHYTPPKAVIEVEVEGAPPIVVTAGHRFHVDGQWIPISEIPLGHTITARTSEGFAFRKLVGRRPVHELVSCHNLTIDEDHNYFVHNLLTHNMGMQRGRSPSDFGSMSEVEVMSPQAAEGNGKRYRSPLDP